MPDYIVWTGLVLLGVGVGAYGTMIGAGGGFVLVPLLLILYPSASPELVTSISLAVVFANALSGTTAYVHLRRVDFLAGNIFAAATVPGAIAGALLVGVFSRDLFDAVFAVVLLLASVLLMLQPRAGIVQRVHRRGEVTRRLVDADGDAFVYSYDLKTGVAISAGVGFVSSMLGIGGGIIHVPMMVLLLRFPTHIATATSHYVLTVTALVGLLVHVVAGDLNGGYLRTSLLVLGVLIGAQAGARLSNRVSHVMLLRLLAVALAAVAARLVTGVLA